MESSHSVTTLTPTSSHQSEQRLDVGGAGAVAVRGVGADGLGPAPVAVEHDADVLGIWSGGRALTIRDSYAG